ncbi:MAG: SDR family oxidoreductase [Nocardioides sp.]|nr:SDR family oxidoreductase [Nocardioides sp.]
MLLEGKNAVIYGGAGAIGSAVAKAFAREGARVFLAGRTQATLDAVAEDIRAARGEAHGTALDARDQRAVDAFVDGVAARAGSVDVSFNLISHGDVQGTPMADMQVEDFMRPIDTAVRSTFITTRAAARHMMPQRNGAILIFGGSGDPVPDYSIGGFQVGLHALEAMRRQLSSELGRYGIRVITLKTGGTPESLPAGLGDRERLEEMLTDATMLKRTATLDDVGNAAAFAASDRARTMTAATINISCGALIDP